MKTMMIETTDKYYNKSNVLICWNPGKYAEKLRSDDEEYGFSVVTSFEEFQLKFKGPEEGSSKKKKDKREKNKKQVRTEAVVVLCELSWGKSTEDDSVPSNYSAMSGIDFVKSLRVTKENGSYEYKIPVVFVSFLSRSQQITRSSKNEIISTPALSHFYMQLPSKPSKWIEELNMAHERHRSKFQRDHVKPIKPLLLEDASMEDIESHFCDPAGMLHELRHDLKKKLVSTVAEREEKFNHVFKQIEDITGDLSKEKIERIKQLPHKTYKEFDKKVNAVYKAIDGIIPYLNKNSLPRKNSSQPIKVVFLDDELNIDKRLKKLIKKMEEYHVEVYPFTDPDEAFKKIDEDKENEIDIVISDFRIWNNDEDPRLMDKMQGYTFLKKCYDLGRTYTYVVFSALDRNFLMKPNDMRTETLYKNGIFEGEYSKLNFIHNLREWGEENRNSIAGQFSKKKVFKLFYNWYRKNTDKVHLEQEINKKIYPIIEQFNKIKRINRGLNKSFPKKCIRNTGNETGCKGCGLYVLLGDDSDKREALTPIYNLQSYRQDNPKKWDLTNDNDIQNLVIKFAARRLYLFYYSSLGEIGNKGCELKDGIANHLVYEGRIAFKFNKPTNNGDSNKSGMDEIDTVSKYHKHDMAKDFWLKGKNPKATPEEKNFLESQGLHID